MTDDERTAPEPELTPEQEAEVSALLARLPDPAMPDDVAARIDAALAGDPSTGPSVSELTTETSGVWRPRGSWLLQAAAVVVLLVIGAGITYGVVLDRDDADPAAPLSAAASESTAALDVSQSGTLYTTDNLSREVRSLLAAGTAWSTSGGTAADEDAGAVAGSAPGGDSAGADAEERSQSDESLGFSASQTVVPEGQTVEAVTALMADPQRRAACVAELTGRDDVAPLAIDVGRFLGRPAAVVVLPVEGGSGTAEAWLVGATCSDADAPFPLHYATVTLP
jgi:hypothetical protein